MFVEVGPNVHASGTLSRTYDSTLESLKVKVTVNPFPNKPWFLRVYSTNLLKTLREKKKLLVTSNFSFSHSVFYPFRELYIFFIKFEIVFCKLSQFGRVQNLWFGKGLKVMGFRLILCPLHSSSTRPARVAQW